jgi:hypothetical protein
MKEARGGNFPQDQYGNDLHRVAIYMTDGVSRKCEGSYPCVQQSRPECANMNDGARLNTPYCWVGHDGSGNSRPITHMGDISQAMHAEIETAFGDSMELFVMAMGLIEVIGLDDVATHPNMVYAARDADQVQNMIVDIQRRVEEDSCIPRMEEPVTWIGGNNEPDPGFLTGAGIYGTAELWHNGAQLPNPQGTVEIRNVDETGRLGFYIPPNEGLRPGMYELRNFNVYYNPSGRANGTEVYNRIRIDSMDATVVEFAIIPEDILGDMAVAPDVLLDLSSTRINTMDCSELE